MRSMEMTFLEPLIRVVSEAIRNVGFVVSDSTGTMSSTPTAVTGTSAAISAIDGLAIGNSSTISTTMHLRTTFRRITSSASTRSVLIPNLLFSSRKWI